MRGLLSTLPIQPRDLPRFIDIGGIARAATYVMTSMRALVADDDHEMLALVTKAIERAGAEVVSVASGDELLDAIADSGPFDVIVTDVAMPWMTGLQVMHSVRTAELLTPVVVMTGLRDPTLPEQVRSLGSRASLLYKPFSIDQLYAALRRCLGKKAADVPRTASSPR